MCGVGFGVGIKHSVAVKIEEIFSAVHEKYVRNYLFRRKFILLIVQSVLRTKVGNAAFSGDARAAEENDALTVIYYALELRNFIHN